MRSRSGILKSLSGSRVPRRNVRTLKPAVAGFFSLINLLSRYRSRALGWRSDPNARVRPLFAARDDHAGYKTPLVRQNGRCRFDLPAFVLLKPVQVLHHNLRLPLRSCFPTSICQKASTIYAPSYSRFRCRSALQSVSFFRIFLPHLLDRGLSDFFNGLSRVVG
jgi:hypothetical protein